MDIRRILLPIGFTDRDAAAARQAAGLARDFGSEIVMLHVNPVVTPALAGAGELGGPIDTGWVTALEAQRRNELNRYGAEELANLTVKRVVVTGDPASEIVSHAGQASADMIVMPTHGYGKLRRFLLGSVTSKVLHDAHCPVWTATDAASARHPTSRGVRRVICALDLSPGCERVADWAQRFATRYNAPLTAFHALPDVDFPDPTWMIGLTEATEKKAAEILASVQVEGKIDIGTGDPAAAIAKEATRRQADLVVIGRASAHHEAGRLWADAYAIVREAPCPVVSV
jgi:nucleotide-binding universal stress UspA family protein